MNYKNVCFGIHCIIITLKNLLLQDLLLSLELESACLDAASFSGRMPLKILRISLSFKHSQKNRRR
jgi:hypothetical protein